MQKQSLEEIFTANTVNNQPQQPQQQAPKKSLEEIFSNQAAPSSQPITPTQKQPLNEIFGVKEKIKTPEKPKAQIPSWQGTNTGKPMDWTERTNKVKAALNRGVSKDGMTLDQNPVRTGFQLTGQIAGAIGDVIGAGFAGAFHALPEGAQKNIKKFAKTSSELYIVDYGLKALSKGMGEYEKWAKKNPAMAADLEGAVNIASLLPVGKGAQATKQLAKTGTEKVLESTAIKEGTALVKNTLAERAAAQATKATKQIDEVVNVIAQGEKKDIPIAARALSDIETAGVKTYTQLKDKITEKITALSQKLDEGLGTSKTLHKLENLGVVEKVGEKTVSSNFVQKAIDDLSEMYMKASDNVNAERVRQLSVKAREQGLTVQDINNLAKEYGVEFKNKAFSKTGDPLTSVSAQSFENTRSGVKKTARTLFQDDAYQIIDSKLTDLIRTRDLVKDVEKKVNKLVQKIKVRTLPEKIGGAAATILDTVSGKSLSGFMQKLIVPRGQGLKIMNALDLEKSLGKNLKKLDKLIEKAGQMKQKDIIIEFKKIMEPLMLPPGRAIELPKTLHDDSGIIKNAPKPRSLEYEPVEGRKLLPSPKSSNEIPIPMRGTTQYDKQVLPKKVPVKVSNVKKSSKAVPKVKIQTFFRGETNRNVGGIIKGKTEFGDAPFVSFADNTKLAERFGNRVDKHQIDVSRIIDLEKSKDKKALDIIKNEIDLSKKQVEELKKLGYDGIIFDNLEPGYTGKELRYFGDFDSNKLNNVKKKVVNSTEKTLVEEAKKHKSAEEFIKAQGVPIYRGQNTSKFSLDANRSKVHNMKGTSFSKEKDVAEMYSLSGTGGGKTPTVIEGFIPQNKIMKFSDLPMSERNSVRNEIMKMSEDDIIEGSLIENVMDRMVPYAELMGKEAIDVETFTNGLVSEIRVLDTSKSFKTKSQLTDIWNKANKKL